MSGFSDIDTQLSERERDGLYRRRRIVASGQGRELLVDGRKLLNFCSNDYLGLANDGRVRTAFQKGVDRWGAGSGASHLVSGHTAAHHDLETALADFTGRARCLLFASGYAANLGTINSLVGPGDHVFEDRLNHASLLKAHRPRHAATDNQRIHITHMVTDQHRGTLVGNILQAIHPNSI